MMQGNRLGAMLLSPNSIDLGLKNFSISANKIQDSFSSILSEKVDDRRNMQVTKNKPVVKDVRLSVKNSFEILRDKELGNTSATSIKNKPSMKADSSYANKSAESRIKTNSDDEESKLSTLEESLDKEEIKETITTLEGLVSLLEELFAKIDNNVAETEVDKTSVETDAMPVEDKNINITGILHALSNGNTEKLKGVLEAIGENQQNSEVNGLIKEIRELINKLPKDEVRNILDASFQLVGKDVSNEELINKLKAQCNEMVNMFNERIEELRSTLKEAAETTGEAVAIVDDGVLSISSDNEVGCNADTNAKEPEAKETSKTEKKAEKLEAKHHNVNTEHLKSQANIAGKDLAQNDVPVSGLGKVENADFSKALKSVHTTTEKPMPQTITNQVMMKVKLMAGENKQEMEMHLKPESLGKLSLKIIHERGEILAKITAESEQVRGILESNMQLLKDALEKSGLNVQSLSVSVGNEKRQEHFNKNSEGNRTNSSTNETEVRRITVSDTDTIYARSAHDFYSNSSQINLTA